MSSNSGSESEVDDSLSQDDVHLLTAVLRLMGVTGAPTEAQFTAACRLIEEAITELATSRTESSGLH